MAYPQRPETSKFFPRQGESGRQRLSTSARAQAAPVALMLLPKKWLQLTFPKL